MNVFYEEDGGFKTGTILADNDASLQVEMASGKRAKIKAANVLLRFEKPAASTLLDTAEPLAENVEAEFLWECASDGEFSFLDFARDYYGHEASSVEATAILLALHAAPIYFHRKGKGRFKKAPADILAAALAGLEKKRQQALAIERMEDNGQRPEQGPVATQILWLGLLFILSTLLSFGIITVFASAISQRLRGSAKAQQALNRAAALVFCGLALRLALAER